MEYRIRAMGVPQSGIVDIPEDIIPLNVFYHPTTGMLMLGVLEEVMEEPKEEKTKEETKEKTEEESTKED